MHKSWHELRDPIHVFIRLSSEERRVLDSRPFQRLRHIHQLALTCLVYPGATHRRFEHSLGVMEVAGRIFDVVTDRGNLSDRMRELLPQVADEEGLRYWRRALRMAALCHDIGHLPFSHAAEDELLPAGWDHERLTLDLIKSPEMLAEALLLARYFMYSQLYFHPVRRIYDIHLKDFLREWLPGGRFPIDAQELLRITDDEVGAAMRAAAEDPSAPGHSAAERIVRREHFRGLYQRHPADVAIDPEAGGKILNAAAARFGGQWVRRDRYSQKGFLSDFPVLMRDGSIVSSIAVSETLAHVPVISVDFVFIERTKLGEARGWLLANKNEILRSGEEGSP